MATPFNAIGVDFDDLFELYVQGDYAAPCGRRMPDGTDLSRRYAHISWGSKRADIGHKANGVDLSNLWAAKGTARYSLGFHGRSYSATAQSPSNATTSPEATLQLSLHANGTWTISRTVANSTGSNGSTTVDSGTWLPAGHAASDYEVQFTGPVSGGGFLSNSAPSYQSLSAERVCSLTASVPPRSREMMDAALELSCDLRRISTGQVTRSNCSFSCQATGWL